jgi:two-component system heavy metal sensor histidine kinase CusS
MKRWFESLLLSKLGSVGAGCAHRTISVSCPDTIELSVCNQGALIAADQLELIFYRCDASRQHAGESGGLGLAIVRSIMQLHHGRVRVSSTAQQTCFSLIFPTKSANTRGL